MVDPDDQPVPLGGLEDRVVARPPNGWSPMYSMTWTIQGCSATRSISLAAPSASQALTCTDP